MVYEQLTGPGRTGTLAAIDATVRMNLVEHAPALVELARNARERNVRRAAVRALGVLGGGFDPGVLVGWMADPVTRDVAIEGGLRVPSVIPRGCPTSRPGSMRSGRGIARRRQRRSGGDWRRGRDEC